MAYFKGNSEKLPINIDCIFQLRRSLRYWVKQQQKEGPVWKVHSWTEGYIGKRAAEHGVVANLCIPERLIALYLTSYHSFHFETRGHCSMCAQGVWFRPDPTTLFFHEFLQIRASTKFLPPPLPEKYPLYGISQVWIQTASYQALKWSTILTKKKLLVEICTVM